MPYTTLKFHKTHVCLCALLFVTIFGKAQAQHLSKVNIEPLCICVKHNQTIMNAVQVVFADIDLPDFDSASKNMSILLFSRQNSCAKFQINNTKSISLRPSTDFNICINNTVDTRKNYVRTQFVTNAPTINDSMHLMAKYQNNDCVCANASESYSTGEKVKMVSALFVMQFALTMFERLLKVENEY